jgi:hypothetical protein
LEFADERARVDARVTLGDDDIVGRDLARADRRGRFRGFQLLEEPEGIVVRADQGDLTGDVLGQLLDTVVDGFERTDEQRVPAHPDLRAAVELSPHRLELSARNAFDADNADRGVPLDELGQLVDLVLFPLWDGLGFPNGLTAAHQASTSTAGPIVVFT